jgi:DNA polymerase
MTAVTELPNYAAILAWIQERNAISRKKAAGLPPPWSDDPVMANYRFCEVRRSDDRQTRWLRQHIGVRFAGHPNLLIMFALARIVNHRATLEELIAKGAWPVDESFDPKSIADVLNERAKRGDANRSSAYHTALIPGVKRPEAVAMIARNLWRARDKLAGSTLQQVHAELEKIDGLGLFIAYQIVVDASYVLLRNAPDVQTWCAVGPGSVRGLNRLHGRATDAKISQRQAMREVLELYRALCRDVPEVPIALSDVPNILCESDKAQRYRLGQNQDGSLTESGGKKGSYKPSSEPLIEPEDGYVVPPPPPDPPPPPPEGDDPDLDDARPGDEHPYADDGKPHLLFIDFETRSACSLKTAGVFRYAADPTTGVWCVAFAVDDGPIQLWKPNDPVPAEFIEAARNPAWQVIVHNAAFERAILDSVLVPKHGWPAIPLERFRCTMAAALALSLPAKLEAVAAVLGLAEQKDAEGARLMQMLAKPRKPRLDEDPDGIYWHDDPELLAKLYDYCRQDVATERSLFKRIGLLPESEQAVWQLDQVVNARGLPIDRKLAEGAVALAAAASAEIDAEMEALTDGAVASPRRVDTLLAWCAGQGVDVATAQKKDVALLLERDDLSATVRRVLELREAGAHIAGSKFARILREVGAGDRVRGTYRYHGAHTGRFSAHGVQPQNLRKPPKDFDIAEAVALISAGDYNALKQRYSAPLDAIGNVVRAAFAAPPGRRLFAADFSGVESRTLAWLSGETSKLALWSAYDAGGDDPYLALGRRLGFPEATARASGKVADLAFGYGGGKGAFRRFGDPDATDEEIEAIQKAWRAEHQRTVQFWHALEIGTLRAVVKPGVVARVNQHVTFCSDGAFLRMKLPSGRYLAYPSPQIEDFINKFGRPQRIVSYEGHTLTRKWTRLRPWYGKWVENVVQAVARDLLAEAIIRLEAANYQVVAHTHDEIVAEAPDGFGSETEFEAIMTTLPAWAVGLPLAAKARSGPRFVEIDAEDGAPSIEMEDHPIVDEELPPWEPEPAIEDDRPPTLDSNGDPRTLDSATSDSEPRSLDSESSGKNGEPRSFASAPPPRSLDSRARSLDYLVEGDRPRDREDYFGRRRTGGKLEREHVYQDHRGRDHMKKLIYRHADGEKRSEMWLPRDGTWVRAKKGELKLTYPFRLPELLDADPTATVFVCEGERHADRLRDLGLVATSGCFGAVKWCSQWNKWFEGYEHVVVLEDNDSVGRTIAAETARQLGPVVKRLQVVSFPELAEKGDVLDWLDAGPYSYENTPKHSKDDLLARCAAVAPWRRRIEVRTINRATKTPGPRQWVMAVTFCRKFLSQVLAAGGTGKTALRVAQALSIATGRELTGERLYGRARVLLLTFEDGFDELEKRILAAMKHHGVTSDETDGWLIYGAVDGEWGTFKEMDAKGMVVDGPLKAQIEELIAEHHPDLIILDPFIKTHAVNENDNTAIDKVAQVMTSIANQHNVAVDAPHHISKTGGEAAGNANRGRGASALVDAARLVTTLTPLSEQEADRFGISEEDRWDYLVVTGGKPNLVKRSSMRRYFRLVGVPLCNADEIYTDGDTIQTVEPWTPPEVAESVDDTAQTAILSKIEAGLKDGERYTNHTAATKRAAWKAVAEVIKDLGEQRCRAVIEEWIKKGILEVRDYYNVKKGRDESGVFVKQWPATKAADAAAAEMSTTRDRQKKSG